jgi:hypothetical protein
MATRDISITIGSVSQNVNTVTIGDSAAAAPTRLLSLFYDIAASQNNGSTATLQFIASKSGNGGRAFQVTVTIDMLQLTLANVGIAGSSANVVGFQVIPSQVSNETDIVLQLELANSNPLATIVINLSGLAPANMSGTAAFTRTSGPFAIPASTAWFNQLVG